MSVELKMPALSPTMEKGTLAKWLVSEGDLVKAGDLVAEVETDKATMELEAVDEGRIAKLLITEGSENVPVGAAIALLVGTDEAVPEAASPAPAPEPVAAAPVPAASSVNDVTEVGSPAPTPPAAMAKSDAKPVRRSPADRIKVSPLAQRIADAKGLDLSSVIGSGPGGRIVRADLGVGAIATPRPSNDVSPVVTPMAIEIAPPPQGVPVETVKLSSMRKTIARRLTESKQNVPHFYLTARCNLDPLLKLRSELNAALEASGAKISVNDMLMKAMATAMIRVPDANVQFGGHELHRFSRVDISMAVAVDGGLITPVVQDVGSLSLSAIASLTKSLATKARENRLTPEEYQGGTASISNLGMFGIDEMFPVINPPQALILGIGAGIEQPWKIDGALGLATVFAATASFDHRAIDGAVAAQFMKAFRDLVETPLTILG